MRRIVVALVLALAPAAHAQAPPSQAFADMEALCARDEETLWRMSLCGPLMIVDPTTRAVSANQADAEGKLTASGGVWTGVLPAGVGVANTALDWAGVRWAMVTAPLPDGMTARRVLLGHEAFHRIQDKLGIAPSSTTNAHLETETGRAWMRLEMRALAAALSTTEEGPRRTAIRDALAFRAARLAAFPGADAEERALDRNEGLAEYTGVRLAAANAEGYATTKLRAAEAGPGFSRSYAYATGPAWGILLDELEEYWRDARWRRGLADRSPAELMAQRVRLDRAPMEERLARHGGAAVSAEEATRAAATLARNAAYRATFSEGPRLIAPLATVAMEFNPNAVTPVDGLGQVYRTLTLRDAWGELVAAGEALVAADGATLTAAAPRIEEGRVAGPDWTLTLKPGWRAAEEPGGVVRIVRADVPKEEAR